MTKRRALSVSAVLIGLLLLVEVLKMTNKELVDG